MVAPLFACRGQYGGCSHYTRAIRRRSPCCFFLQSGACSPANCRNPPHLLATELGVWPARELVHVLWSGPGACGDVGRASAMASLLAERLQSHAAASSSGWGAGASRRLATSGGGGESEGQVTESFALILQTGSDWQPSIGLQNASRHLLGRHGSAAAWPTHSTRWDAIAQAGRSGLTTCILPSCCISATPLSWPPPLHGHAGGRCRTPPPERPWQGGAASCSPGAASC
jgi:hypothetical protein